MAFHIDHAREARAWLNGLDEVISGEGQTDATLVAVPLIAQVHATLALAEQQKIANLIALGATHSPGETRQDGDMIIRTSDRLREDIRKGLGLA